tara:strand:+ start:239 stop:454 length:216 start_codon:yes stop_codon:yes gene_type:complete
MLLLPFRALRFVPSTPGADVLAQPILHRTTVTDLIDIPYAYDIELTQGFYLLLATFVTARVLLHYLKRRRH